MRRRTLLTCCAALVWACAAQPILACPSCFGDPSSSEVQGMKWAIISLLVVTGTVLAAVGGFFLYLRRRTIDINRRFSSRLN